MKKLDELLARSMELNRKISQLKELNKSVKYDKKFVETNNSIIEKLDKERREVVDKIIDIKMEELYGTEKN